MCPASAWSRRPATSRRRRWAPTSASAISAGSKARSRTIGATSITTANCVPSSAISPEHRGESMSSPAALLASACPTLTLLARGKVRDVYQVDAEHLLFVASDRISAFDVVMANGIPGKGKVLTQLSLFWFDLLARVMPNHLVTADIALMPAS